MTSYYFKIMKNPDKPESTLLSLIVTGPCIPTQTGDPSTHNPEGYELLSIADIQEDPNSSPHTRVLTYEGPVALTEPATKALAQSFMRLCERCLSRKDGTCLGVNIYRQDANAENPKTEEVYKVINLIAEPSIKRRQN